MFLQLKGLKKIYEEEKGLKNLDLEIEEGSFVTLLGPSGCGKTTTLNLLGGFIQPDSGHILLEGEDITGLPPERRPVSTVFQSYALFPHLNVLDNVCYGLRFFRGMKKKEAAPIAMEELKTVGLSGYETARIGELSGGQQQRVALARAMATGPNILLLDEPLSNLDAGLRVQLREELKELQKKLGITMVFVPSVSTFAISKMLGGGSELLLGDLIELQFFGGAYNPQLGAAISLVMMVIVVACMVLMNRFGEGEEQAVML